MNMSVLIDTNVILDALIGRAPHHIAAEKILLLVAEDKLNAAITASSVTDIYYLLHKYLHDADQAKQVLLKLFRLFEVLDVTGSDCEKALSIPMRDYEDALLATCAKRRKLDLIITRNLKDFAESPIKAVTPDDVLAKFF
ncbi:MAG: PIN domain-containing protein [Desulfitobacterium hafniense]|nr:PIN domain-containing protein [Desulfitobacterium hafniense]